MKKRYAIVRVGTEGKHKVCPMFLENNIEEICIGRHICEDCRYGDTKEQLIRKVAQGIIIASRKRQIYIGNPKAFSKAVSKIIVEFLGVE